MAKENEYGSRKIFYECFYGSVIFGKGFGANAVRRTHLTMERQWGGHFKKVLEIGSGNGEHLDFIKHGFDEYVMLDLVKTVLNAKWSSDGRIKALEANAESIPFNTGEFDRVVSTCLLHHVDNPEKVLNEISRVLSPTGVCTIFLSCDPGLAVRTLRKISTARSAKRKGFKGYNLMIAREHRNHFASLLEIAKFVFQDREFEVKYYPFGLESWNLNGYAILTVGKILPKHP
ncbi:SmtA SAM-dependent methyltransferases [Candidatus Nanopelagicaceae bacterium]